MPDIIHNLKLKILQFIPLFIILLKLEAKADDEWDKVRFEGLKEDTSYIISSGTGFFVASNIIVTSKHVVENCLNIAARGAINPTQITLLNSDEADDLALLHSPIQAPKIPFLSINYKQILAGDAIFTIGYPLDRGKSGLYILKPANVVRIYKSENSEFSEIEFTDSIDHGNSGGPILDRSGNNIIGIVKAKATYTNDVTNEKIIRGVGVGIDALLAFLSKNNILYSTSNSFDMVINYRSDIEAKNYIVNIHCIRQE